MLQALEVQWIAVAASDRLLIPRIIHRVWVGPNPMPEEFQRYGETWRQHHPDWEIRLWTDDNLPEFQDPGSPGRARSLTERSDVVRYEVLRQFGGVYVDADFECVRPLDPLLAGVEGFAAATGKGVVKSGIVGGPPHHPLFELAVREVSRLVGTHEGAWHPGVKPIGPKFFARLIEDFPQVRIFEADKFYPYAPWEDPRPAHEYPGAYAVHRWARTGRDPENLSPEELRDTIRAMRDEYTQAIARVAKARARAERAQRSVRKLEARLAAAESRIAEVEGSLWWRLRPRLPRRRRRG